MSKFNELLKKLNELNITQTKGDWAEDLPDNIWNDHFKGNFKCIKSKIDPEPSIWYEVATDVIEIYDRLLGISYITNLFSESMSYDDCYVTIEFVEMKPIQTITYEPINYDS